MIRRTFFKWAASAAVTAIVELRNFGPMEIPFAGGVELEPGGQEVYEERISTTLQALDAWNLKRVAVQGACSQPRNGLGNLVSVAVCGRGNIGCTVVHPAYGHADGEGFYSTERWIEAERKWVLELKIRDGEKREVVGSVETLAKAMNKGMADQSRRRFFGRAIAKGKQFDWEG